MIPAAWLQDHVSYPIQWVRGPRLRCLPAQSLSGTLIATVVPFRTTCPRVHWSNEYVCPPSWYCQLIIARIFQTVEHFSPTLLTSRRVGGAPHSGRRALARPLAVPGRSNTSGVAGAWISGVFPARPQTSVSARPLTGGGRPGFGNHVRMLHVLQFGPPTMNLMWLFAAIVQRVL